MLFLKVFVFLYLSLSVSVQGKAHSYVPEGRIAKGKVVEPPEPVPFVVALLYEVNSTLVHGCGGSLISENHVLTAAHCLQTNHQIVPEVTVALGVFNRSEEESTQLRLKVEKSNFTIHADYEDKCSFGCDIAIIRLPQKVATNKQIQLIQLPSQSNVNGTFSNVVTYGWGCTRENMPAPIHCTPEYHSEVLRYANISVTLRGNSPNFNSNVDVDDQGICFFDSGGPVVSQGVQIGINDYVRGLPYCLAGDDGFVSVPYFLDWIKNNTKS